MRRNKKITTIKTKNKILLSIVGTPQYYCHGVPERTAKLSALSVATGYNYRVHECAAKLSALWLHMHIIITEFPSKKK